jgi:phosphoribosylformylglycinamidine synthase
MTVAESTLNVACAGARPVALVNCLNFGNPEHAEVMWQFAEAIDGMAEACRALKVPVVGGNVSFYNATRGRDIDPTPIIGVLGVIDELVRRPPGIGLVEGASVALLGALDTDLAGSAWADRTHGVRGSVLPALDLELHRRLLELVAGLVVDGAVGAVHDVSDGGIGVALVEMALRGSTGCRVAGIPTHRELFSEAASRVVVCVDEGRLDEIAARATDAGIAFTVLGSAGGDRLVVDGLLDLPLAEAAARFHDAIPAALTPELL